MKVKAERKYPLEIKSVGEDTYMVMSKGHHEPKDFMIEVKRQGYDWPLGNPKHFWAKTTPCNCGEGHACHYALTGAKKKGYFPVTYSVEAYGEEQYQSDEPCEVSDG